MISPELRARTEELLRQRLERALAAATQIKEQPEILLSVPTTKPVEEVGISSKARPEAAPFDFKKVCELRILFKDVSDVPRNSQGYLLKKHDALVVVKYEDDKGFVVFDGKSSNWNLYHGSVA